MQLHGITALIAVDHGNCGALGIAYGQRVLDDPKLELAAHLADAKKLKEELAVRHPDLDYQAWFVDRRRDWPVQPMENPGGRPGDQLRFVG